MTTSTKFHQSHASRYEEAAGGTTGILAQHIVSNISPPITSASTILDNACGTGIVSSIVKAKHPDAVITATDITPAMIQHLDQRISENQWTNMKTDLLDIRDLKSLHDETFSHVITNLGLQVVPDDAEAPLKAAKEIYRVLKSGGVSAASVWNERTFIHAVLATARIIRPQEEPVNKMALPPSWELSSFWKQTFSDAGFGSNVSVEPAESYISAATLDAAADQLMIFKDFFFVGYNEDELKRAREVLKDSMKKLNTYTEVEGSGVRIGMKAWIIMGRKV